MRVEPLFAPVIHTHKWITARLGECVDILDSERRPINATERQERIAGKPTNELFPYYGATGQAGWIDDFIFNEEVVLLGEDGAPFLDSSKDVAYLISGKTWVNNHAHVLRGRKALVLNRYLMHFLNCIDYSPYVTGTTRLKLNQARMREMPISLPPMQEQIRIVAKIEELFTKLEAGVAALKKTQVLLKRYRQAVLKAAVEGELSRAWREANPDVEPANTLFDSANLMNASNEIRNGVPSKWARVRFDSLLREPLRNGHSAKETKSGDGIRTLTLTAVTLGDFSEKNTKVTVADAKKVEQLWLEPGDILIERSNTPELVGTARLYVGPNNFAIFPDLVIRARLSEKVNARYAETVLHSQPSRTYFKSKAQGISGSMPKISQPTIEALLVPVPPLKEQDFIVSELERRFSLLDSLQATLNAELKRSEQLRQAILNKAFSGQLVPQNPDEEPASALLERIRAEKQESTSGKVKSGKRTKQEKLFP